MLSLAQAAPLCAALAFGQGARPTPAAFPESLEGWRVPASVRLASDASGNVAGWDHATGELALWSRAGKRKLDCPRNDVAPGNERGLIALRGTTALLTFMDHAAGSETARKAAVVDLTRCEAKAEFTIDGLATQAVATKGGWLVVSSPESTFSRTVTFRLIRDDGGVDGELDIAHEAEGLAKDRADPPAAGRRSARAFQVRSESWLIPNAVYELWRPAQHGKPFRRIEPPPCLEAKGMVLDGEENRRHVLDLIKTWDEGSRSHIEPALKEGKGQLAPSYLATTSDLASYRNLVAVVVRDPVTRIANRLDVWDMLLEVVVAVLPFPADARLIALAEGYAWIRDGNGFMRRLELPDLTVPVGDPCTALAAVRTARASRQATSEPTPTGQAAQR